MIHFKAKTEEEVSKIFKKGIYQATLLELRPVKSKDGSKDMAYIKIEIRNSQKTGEVEDRIPFIEKMEWKWRHFCYAFGLEKMYESEVFEGRPTGEYSGNVIIGIEEDITGQYPPKNKVIDYIQKESNTNAIKDDDIKF